MTPTMMLPPPMRRPRTPATITMARWSNSHSAAFTWLPAASRRRAIRPSRLALRRSICAAASVAWVRACSRSDFWFCGSRRLSPSALRATTASALSSPALPLGTAVISRTTRPMPTMATAAYIVQSGRASPWDRSKTCSTTSVSGSAMVVNAVAVRTSVPTGSETLTSASDATTESGIRAVTWTWLASASASPAKVSRRACGVGADHGTVACLGHRLEGLEGRTVLGDRDDVDQDPAVRDRRGDVGQLGVGRVGAVGEHQHGPLTFVTGQVDGREDAVVEPGLLGQGEALDDGPCVVAVLARRQRRLDVGVEGDDADVDVVGHRVEERQRGLPWPARTARPSSSCSCPWRARSCGGCRSCSRPGRPPPPPPARRSSR